MSTTTKATPTTPTTSTTKAAATTPDEAAKPASIGGQRQVPALRYALAAASAISGRLALALAHKMYFTVRKRPMQGGERAALERARTGELTVGKRTVPTYEWGSGGRVIVFVHGWEGSGVQVQAFLPALTEAGYRVVAFDAPGHGRAGGGTTEINEMSAIVQALIARLRGEPGVVIAGMIAHSFGSMVTSHVLLQPGVEVGRVALLSSIYSFDTLLEGFRQVTGASDRLVARLKERLERGLGCGWYDISGETLAPRQQVPALLVHDEADREVPAADSRRLHEQWRGSELHLTSGLGHYRILQHAGVVQRVAAFFGAQPAEQAS